MKCFRIICFCIAIVKMSSCVNTRPVQYLQGQFDTAALSKYVVKRPIIQVGDLISIAVYSDNPEATAIYNLPNSGSSQNGSAAGYLVDEQGNIQLQGIGKLHIAGLTREELVDLLNSKLSVYLKNPYYNIRFLNYKITMIGEVVREGVYNVPDERINILESIGLAGGLTLFARRENVMVIRESNGKREFARLDLTNPDLLNSPYYFLQQNDMVIVEQARAKPTASEQATTRNIGLISGIVSTLAILYTILSR